MKIKIREIPEAKVELYSPDNELIGVIDNEVSFLDVRVQIHNQQLKGYYIVFNGIRCGIDRNGELDVYPEGLYDTRSDLLMKLL